MKVSLIDYTGFGSSDPEQVAIKKLIFVKNTRLSRDLKTWKLTPGTGRWAMEELERIAATIPSCWEFVHYTFLIEGVTRAFTHQFVRTRTASFAQQSLRVVDLDAFGVDLPDSVRDDEVAKSLWEDTISAVQDTYSDLVKRGTPLEDARGVLPTNVLTNIIGQFNLRTLAEMMAKRLSPRVQGEYRAVLLSMMDEVYKVHPFAKLFLDPTLGEKVEKLHGFLKRVVPSDEDRLAIIKMIDAVRGEKS